jgi:hypothetical protein
MFFELDNDTLLDRCGELLAQEQFDYEGYTSTRNYLIDMKTRSRSREEKTGVGDYRSRVEEL